ncbi:hypothetical protein C0995_010286 [Termitomyces sp. Mi166|nr:hypothetical protein C0995_010286 [Termitomyces sp. Mi166\
MRLNPRLPLLSGQSRFRITPSNDPAQFESGTDLLNADGESWNLDALQLVHPPALAPLKEQLYHDGYAEFVQALSKLPYKRNIPSTVLLGTAICYGHRQQGWPNTRGSPLHRTGCCALRALHVARTPTRQILSLGCDELNPIKPVYPSYDMYLPVPRVGSLLLKREDRVRSYNLDDLRASGAVCGLKDLPSDPDTKPDT